MGNRTGSKRKEQQARDDDLPLWGVPLSFLKDWTKKNVNENQTTAQVCQDIILLLTKKRRCSFLDGVDIPKVKANRFISHSWSYKFATLVETLVDQELSLGSDLSKVFVWIDTLVVNQHKAPHRSQEWWSSTFHEAIKQIGTVVLVVEPWYDPKALTRAWCLWEIYGCARFNANFRLALNSSEKDNFIHTLIYDFTKIQALLAMVDSINAAAWNPDDLLMIRKAIESSIGYEGVNRMVLSQIRSWLITTAVDFIAKPSAMVSKELNQAGGKALLMNQIAKLYHLQEFGPESEQAARDMNNLGHLLNLMNNFDSAKQYLERARAIRARVFGDDSAEVARVTYNIGEVLESQGKFDECIVMFQSSSNVLVKLKRNHEALKVFQGLGRVYRAKGDFKMSDIIFKTAMELGSDIVTHPDMALLLGTYAALLTDIDRFNEAKEMLERSRAIQIRNLGEKHPNVSDLDNNLARLQCRLGNYEDALKSQSSALEIDKLVFGEHDLSTARDHSNMGHLLNMLGRLEEAEEHLKQALSIRGQLLGTTNIIYARSLCNYANTEIQSGKFQTALQKLQQARQTIQTCAVDHPDLNEVDSLIGKCFYSKGQYEDAENCWKTAISKDTSPNSAKIDYMLQLAKCLTDAQKFDEAERNLITAEQLAEEVCKGLEQNFYQASILSGKARLLEAKGDLDEAICFQRKALEKSQFDTLEASLDLNNLGYLLTERPTSLETLDEGITLLRKAVNIRRGALGKTNPLTLRSNYNLGQALCQKLTIDNQVYEEGIQAVRFSVQHMEKGENAVHAMIARLGLSKILLMSPSKTSKSELDSILPLLEDERMKQLPSFLKLELSVLKSYIAKNDASLEAQVVEYREAGTAKGMKYDMNIPLFLILQARTTMNQDNAIKLLHEAQEYCEKMTLWTDHIYYKEIHRMKGNIHTS